MKALTLRSVNPSGEDQDILPNQRLEKSVARVDALQFPVLEFDLEARHAGERAQQLGLRHHEIVELLQGFVDRGESSAGIDGSIPIRGGGCGRPQVVERAREESGEAAFSQVGTRWLGWLRIVDSLRDAA